MKSTTRDADDWIKRRNEKNDWEPQSRKTSLYEENLLDTDEGEGPKKKKSKRSSESGRSSALDG